MVKEKPISQKQIEKILRDEGWKKIKKNKQWFWKPPEWTKNTVLYTLESARTIHDMHKGPFREK